MKKSLLISIIFIISVSGLSAQTRERFANPTNEDRIYMLQHDTRGDAGALLDKLGSVGFGGIVTNADWHTGKSDKESVMSVMALKPQGYMLKSMPKEEILKTVDNFFETSKWKNI